MPARAEEPGPGRVSALPRRVLALASIRHRNSAPAYSNNLVLLKSSCCFGWAQSLNAPSPRVSFVLYKFLRDCNVRILLPFWILNIRVTYINFSRA